MRDKNAKSVKLGDRIRISNGDLALVVISADSDEYSSEFPRSECSFVAKGILVKTDSGALVQLDESLGAEIELI